ncbi:MAG: hypothetical protein QNL18_01730 [Pseudomonadales bacterium]|jgi:hypothetical protein
MHIDLAPFSPCPAVQHLGYELLLESSSSLRLIVQLEGSLAATLPITNRVGQRQFGLWQHHCFELFIGELESNAYWELNLAPNGNWNCFEFSDYRKDQRESEAYSLAGLQAVRSAQSYRLEANIDIKPILKKKGLEKMGLEARGLEARGLEKGSLALSLGASAVIATATQLNYFSIRHGATPDFHHRDHHMQWVLQ